MEFERGNYVRHADYGYGRVDSEVEFGHCWLRYVTGPALVIDHAWVKVRDLTHVVTGHDGTAEQVALALLKLL